MRRYVYKLYNVASRMHGSVCLKVYFNLQTQTRTLRNVKAKRCRLPNEDSLLGQELEEQKESGLGNDFHNVIRNDIFKLILRP